MLKTMKTQNCITKLRYSSHFLSIFSTIGFKKFIK